MSAMNESPTAPEAPRFDRDGMTLAQLRACRDTVLRIAAAHDASNVRVFGSGARGDAAAGSDVDLVVDIVTAVRGFAYFGLLEDLRRSLADALRCEVDVVDSAGLKRFRESVLREAVAL